MSRVHDVDPALIRRAADWLIVAAGRRRLVGERPGLVHENTWSSLGNDRLPVTAYITWSLIDAGFADEAATQKGLDYLRENYKPGRRRLRGWRWWPTRWWRATWPTATNSAAPRQAVLDRLAGLAAARRAEGLLAERRGHLHGLARARPARSRPPPWRPTSCLRAGDVTPTWPTAPWPTWSRQKDSFGTWYSTQATVLALKALIQSVRAGGERVNASVTLRLNGGQETHPAGDPGELRRGPAGQLR